MSQTLSLYRLQQIDNHIGRTQARIGTIQTLLGEDEALVKVRIEVESAEEIRLSAAKTLHQAEIEADDLRLKIEQIETSLYSGVIKNPKELQDLQQESLSLKKHLATLEEKLLEAMLAHEEADSHEKQAGAKLAETQNRIADEHRCLFEEMSGLNREIDKRTTERQVIVSAIKAEHLDLYARLIRQKKGIAVAGVSDNACDVCGTTLTPAQNQAAQSTNQITFCPSCGRIIYHN